MFPAVSPKYLEVETKSNSNEKFYIFTTLCGTRGFLGVISDFSWFIWKLKSKIQGETEPWAWVQLLHCHCTGLGGFAP